MKKSLTRFIPFFIAVLLLMPRAYAQKTTFTGTVVYDVKVEGDIPEQAKSMMPTEMTCKFTADKESLLMNFGMMIQKTVYDAATQEANAMMDVMGQKLVIKSNAAELSDYKKKQNGPTIVKFTDETKTIAGYPCKKAIVTVKPEGGAESTFDVFYTDDIDLSNFKFSNPFAEINGLPLEFTMKNGPISLKLMARSIKKEKIPTSEFIIASDYKQVTSEQLKTMFGGGAE